MRARSFALAWLRDAKKYLETCVDPLLGDPGDCEYFRQKHKKIPKVEPAPVVFAPPPPSPKIEAPPPAQKVYPSEFENWGFAEKAAPIFCSGASDHCQRQGASEDKKFAAKPTESKTNFRIDLGIEAPPPPAPIVESEPSPPTIKKGPAATGLRALFAKALPEVAYFAEIPNDAIAKKIASRWKTKNQTFPITVLSFQENASQKALLGEIAKALDVYFGPARLLSAETIERENQWEAFLSVADLKLVVACDYTLWQLPNLMRFYRETPAQKTRQLGEKPLFMLPDLSLYLKDPLLKRSLWRAICTHLSLSTKK